MRYILTVINNVEPIVFAPTILRLGSNWFSNIGTKNNTDTKIYCISCHVNKQYITEEDMGISLKKRLSVSQYIFKLIDKFA